MLKIFEKSNLSVEPVSYLFHFNSPDPVEARQEANALKDLLSKLITETRSKDPSVPQPRVENGDQAANGGGGASAAMSFASTANAKPASARWFDDNQLKGDIELQQALLKSDASLNKTYMDARATKPDSISDAAFNAQFWSTRTNLLRAFAIETHQKKGAYNVLSTLKARTEDGELKLTITLEQVQMIFNTHPLVKRIYNEHVGPPPKLNDSQFWARFFLSRLSKKLRGERVSENDIADAIFDKYDENDDIVGFSSKIMQSHVPHIIDIEGNEENQGGFKGGNQKDIEMRPRANIPIVKTLNSLSEKIMANVAPSDNLQADPAAPEEESTYRELALRDLQGDVEENRIILRVSEQSQFFSSQKDQQSADAEVYAKQVPSDVLFDIQADIDTLEGDGAGGIDLHAGIGADESDSDDEGGSPRPPHVGSRAARAAAQEQILASVRQRAAELYGATGGAATADSPLGLPTSIAERCYLTNATTIEFLQQFWRAFLSGDPDRAGELAYLVEALGNSQRRIEAVADDAERARDEAIAERRREIRDHFARTGKKIRWKADSVGGGRAAVMQLMSSTVNSLKKAQAEYQRALAAEGVRPNTE